MKNTSRAFLLALLVAASAPLCAQGLYWESMSSSPGFEIKGEHSYMPGKIKVVTSQEEGEVMIFRLDRNKVYTINPAEKTYSEMTFEEMERAMKDMAGALEGRMGELKKQMEDMPEEQRKMMEQMMGGMMKKEGAKEEVSVKKTGEKKTLSGFSCMKYVVSRGGKEMFTIWTTNDIREYEGMRKDFEEFSARMTAMNPMMEGYAEAMRSIEGFPIETSFPQGMKTVVTKVERRSIAPAEFEVPPGYKKVKPRMMEEIDDEGEN